ncbi:MAG TPA: dockerin type I repeat-containing protein [candidate division Zixibacteria bacterium]|nr:dockerin type I repeat-containing protein [candidate division Zixibacteria bacterium]MDD4918772.1 dockerin type I repeat-containing protein [candidate division Zixibacteria bacterium]HPM37041.1 dockerin type I repeat-containing protein [candidate division Zixibacteria bacterium]
MRKRTFLWFVILGLGLAAGSTASAVSDDPLALIAQDYRAGAITLDQKVLLQIQAITSPAALPDRYVSAGLAASGGALTRCATPVILEIRREWELLQPETKAVFSAAFQRAVTEAEYLSPSGWFKLHYDTTGADAVPPEDADMTGVPDLVEKCAAYLDSSRTRHLDYGYRMPPPDSGLGGDDLFDVYFEETGAYGYAMPEGPGPEPWNDVYSYLVLNNDFLGFAPNYDPEGDQLGAAKATCAHEFHHCVQFAYDSNEDSWFMEMDATHIEDIVFDATDDNYNYLPTFFNAPERSLMEAGSHAYSTFLWGIYLAESFDTLLMPAIWEGARFQTAFAAMTDTLFGQYGWTRDSAFADFTVWNYLTSGRDDGLHYGETYPQSVKIGRAHSMYPVLLQTSPSNAAGYGACYIEFYPGSKIGRLEVTVNGDDARQWSAYLIKSTAPNVHTVEKIPLASGSYFGVGRVPEFESYYRVALVVANIMEYSSGAFFNYSAEVIPPYEVTCAAVTLDSSVYSGGRRDFEFLITNVAPLSDIIDVTARDDSGWVVSGPAAYSLSPESDSVVRVQIAPPEGTVLGSVSAVWCRAASRGNPAVVDSQLVFAQTVLQRGDVNFDGGIQVSDLTYFIAYLFRGGAAPVPAVAAGDVSCDGGVDVRDLSALVAYLFRGGSPAPCNPY